MIVVFDDGQEVVIIHYADARILARVFPGNRKRFIRAAIVDNGVITVCVGLPQDAFNAFREILGAIVHGRDYAHQRLSAHTFLTHPCLQNALHPIRLEEFHFQGKWRGNRVSRSLGGTRVILSVAWHQSDEIIVVSRS